MGQAIQQKRTQEGNQFPTQITSTKAFAIEVTHSRERA